MYYPIKVTAYNTTTGFTESWTFEGKSQAYDFARSLSRTTFTNICVDGWFF